MNRNTRPYNRYPHTCPICGKDFLGRIYRVYCSHECSAEGSSKRFYGKERVARLAAKSEKARRRRFFAKLDAAYEAAYPGLQSGDVRGRIAIGGRSGVIRACDTGAIVRKYIAPTSEK